MNTNKGLERRTRVSAYGIVVDENKRLLLSRLSAVVEQHVGKWILPGGGLEFGEDPQTATVREIKEETGLNASIVKLLDVDSTVVPFNGQEVHAIRFIYQATVEAGELKIEQQGSTDACDWFNRDQLKYLPMVSVTAKALKLLGWDNSIGSKNQLDKCDLSLTGLIQYYDNQADPRSSMTVDYLQEIRDIHIKHTESSRRRLTEMRKYR